MGYVTLLWILVQELIFLVKHRVVAEVLAPLKKHIFHQMVDNNIPTYYHNVNMLKALHSLGKNENFMGFYINIFQMNNEFI